MAINLTRCRERPDVLEVSRLEGGDLGVFLGEGTDKPGARKVLLGLGGDVRKHSLDALEPLVDAGPEGLDEDAGDGQRDDGEGGKPWADVDHERQGGSREDDGVGGVHDGRPEELADGGQVVGGAGHDVAGAMGLVEAGGLAFEISEEVVAEVELDLARSADQDLASDKEEDSRAGCDEEQAQGVMQDLLLGDAGAEIVYSVTDDQRQQDLDGVVEHDRDPTPGEVLPVALEVGRERADLFNHGD